MRCIARAEQKRSLFTDEAGLAWSVHREDQDSQFVGPRFARSASEFLVRVPLHPRSKRLAVNAAAVRRFCAAGYGVKVRPNPSLQPTVTGMALGPRSALVHHAPRGPSAMPLPAAELER
mgnify:CR=1 FL=1